MFISLATCPVRDHFVSYRLRLKDALLSGVIVIAYYLRSSFEVDRLKLCICGRLWTEKFRILNNIQRTKRSANPEFRFFPLKSDSASFRRSLKTTSGDLLDLVGLVYPKVTKRWDRKHSWQISRCLEKTCLMWWRLFRLRKLDFTVLCNFPLHLHGAAYRIKHIKWFLLLSH